MTVAIRPYAAGELAALHAVRTAAFAPVFASFRSIVGSKIAGVAFADAEAEQAALLDRLAEPKSGSEILVAEIDAAIAGFVAVTFDAEKAIGEIVLTAVHPCHSGKGFGTRLNEAALDRMRTRGMRVATVGTGGDESHAAARRAYEKAGFGQPIPSLYYYRSLDGD